MSTHTELAEELNHHTWIAPPAAAAIRKGVAGNMLHVPNFSASSTEQDKYENAEYTSQEHSCPKSWLIKVYTMVFPITKPLYEEIWRHNMPRQHLGNDIK